MTFSIGEALKVGWQQFKKRPWYLLGITLGFWVLIMASGAQNALFTALMYLLYGGFIALFLAHYDGKTIKFDDMFDIDNRWLSFAVLGMVKTLIIMVGFLLFIIPGVYLAIKWSFAEILVIEKGMRPMEALRESSRLTKGNRWKLFFFGLIVGVLMLLGLIVFIIGGVVVSIVVMFAAIKIYRDLQAPKPAEPTEA